MFCEKNYETEKIKKVKKVKNLKKLEKNKKIMKNLKKTEKNRKKPKMSGFGKKGEKPEISRPSTILRIAGKYRRGKPLRVYPPFIFARYKCVYTRN